MAPLTAVLPVFASTAPLIYALAGLLVLVAVALVVLGVRLVRATRSDPAALGPLEAMGDRSFRRGDPSRRTETIDHARPPGAEPLPGASAPAAEPVASEAVAAAASAVAVAVAADQADGGAEPAPAATARPEEDGEPSVESPVDTVVSDEEAVPSAATGGADVVPTVGDDSDDVAVEPTTGVDAVEIAPTGDATPDDEGGGPAGADARIADADTPAVDLAAPAEEVDAEARVALGPQDSAPFPPLSPPALAEVETPSGSEDSVASTAPPDPVSITSDAAGAGSAEEAAGSSD